MSFQIQNKIRLILINVPYPCTAKSNWYYCVTSTKTDSTELESLYPPSVCWPPEHIDCVFDNDASPVERFQKITVISQYARIIVQRWDINMPRAELEIRILCLIEHMQCFQVQRTYVGKYLCCIKCAITTLAVKLKIDSNAIQTPTYHPIDNLQS